jgi:protocatechuate 3,4-dioxygenase beta subunit
MLDDHDRGLAFDLERLMSRRRALGVLAAGMGSAALVACGSSSKPASNGSSQAAEIPDETSGPFPGDGSNGPDVLATSGIVRSDIRSSWGDAGGTAQGVPMTLTLTVTDLADGGVPFEGAAVYVWHCDREGGYSLYSDGLTDENYLRGVQVADADGTVTFTSVFPGCYPGRWPHVHFEVYPDQASITDSTTAIATSQLALPEDVCDTVYGTSGYEASVAPLAGVSLDSDIAFGDDSGVRQLGTVTGDLDRGYAVSLAVGVDPS